MIFPTKIDNCPEKMNTSNRILTLVILFFSANTFAQEKQANPQNEASYQKVIMERATKIVKTLALEDSSKALKVRDIIANQYKNLNAFHEERKIALKEIGKDNSKAKSDSLSKIYTTESKLVLGKLHKVFLKNLNKELTKKQVDDVKNGMTYSVFPNTFRAYQDMMPDLTKKQKKQLFDYLYEAREHAMDAESSEKKHAWFGKYKGRINNYLSNEGIDMKVVSLAWEKRIREAEEAKKNNSPKSAVKN
jgi:hypothetical protein